MSQPPQPPTGRIVQIGLDDELAESYGRYAQAIILDRAIPDARDGLKPVQRRILFAMHESGNTHDKPYRKSAKTVGDVMGNYHPHGDQSIYEALVRMAQPWKLRYPLIDGHGNFGSLDDDPPAAMRYTEARLSQLSLQLLTDIEKATVNWRPNFDDKSLEPTVLPAAFPNLLCNGTSGVSTGFATEIPPHNLGEVIEAAIQVLHEPDVTLDALMSHVRGPDFPTGGILTELDGLREAYASGRGRVLLQSRWTVEPQRDGKTLVVVTELPYGVVKARLVGDLEAIRMDKAVVGLVDVRDESDREGLRVVIELGRGADVEGVLAVLLKKTDLQTYYHFNMVAIHEGRPKEMGLKALLLAFVDHRCEVVRRRSQFDLDKSQARLHVVEGLIRAVDLLDEIIATIRASEDRAHARANLAERFAFSEVQADAILDLRLHRLTNLQILDLRAEFDALLKTIAELQRILAQPEMLRRVVEQELRALARQYADARRTEIRAHVERFEVSVVATVKAQEVIVALSRQGYLRRASMASFRASGESISALGTKDGDAPIAFARTNTQHKVLLFSKLGTCFAVPVHQLPEDKWTGPGTALVNVVPIDKADRAIALHAVDFAAPEAQQDQLLFVTEMGMVKRTAVAEFDASRSSGILACALQPKDSVVAVLRTSGVGDLLLVTRQGMSIRFRQSDVSIQGRNARGVRGIGLEAGDAVIGVVLLPPFGDDAGISVAVVTDQGKAKRTPASDLTRQLRAGKGSRIVVAAKRAPVVVAFALAGVESSRWWVWDQGGHRAAIEHRQIQTTVRDGRVFGALEMAQSPTHGLAEYAPPVEPAAQLEPAGTTSSAPDNGGSAEPDLFDG